ncbi:hypothetical protein TDB9533_00597 [Thalassocella blandensis]|nr:hypothetical protein TDB9533_00597 [Thalassocella blandensis]
MDENQFNAIKIRAKDSWETAEKYRIAYLDISNINSKFSSALKWLTLAAGVITGLSTLPQFFGQEASNNLTAISGMITGLLTLSEKLFQWEQKSNEYWANSKSLESLQSEIYQFLVAVLGGDSSTDISFKMQRFHEKVKDTTQLRLKDENKYSDLAKTAIQQHKIATIQYHTIETEEIEEIETIDSLPESAEGVVTPRSAI